MLFAFEETDFEPISRFGLLWRWTSPGHAELPTQVLNGIRPIAGAKAAMINHYAVEWAHAVWPHLGISSEFSFEVRRLDTKQMDDGVVRAWLVSLPVPADETVIVSWDARTAVTASFAVVAKYWSDFFYPSSDDAVVLPLNVEWMIVWDHHESFEFGKALPESDDRATFQP